MGVINLDFDDEQPLVELPPAPREWAAFPLKLLKKEIKAEKLSGIQTEPEDDFTREQRAQRPKTRGDCEDGPRPCPWVSCRHHLYLEVAPDSGLLSITHAKKDLDEIAETCALDVAKKDGMTLEEVGEILGVSRERIRQIEERSLRKLLHSSQQLKDWEMDKREDSHW